MTPPEADKRHPRWRSLRTSIKSEAFKVVMVPEVPTEFKKQCEGAIAGLEEEIEKTTLISVVVFEFQPRIVGKPKYVVQFRPSSGSSARGLSRGSRRVSGWYHHPLELLIPKEDLLLRAVQNTLSSTDNAHLGRFFGVRKYFGARAEFSSGGVAKQGLNVRVEPYTRAGGQGYHYQIMIVGVLIRVLIRSEFDSPLSLFTDGDEQLGPGDGVEDSAPESGGPALPGGNTSLSPSAIGARY
eukprot:3172111-Pyramimonas_sp.AAC.1